VNRSATAEHAAAARSRALAQRVTFGSSLRRLGYLQEQLLNGCLPINGAGVRIKPAAGTCPPDLVAFFRGRGIQVEGP